MPKRKKAESKKKQPQEMTTEELADKVFPKEVAKRLKEIAHEKNDKPKP